MVYCGGPGDQAGEGRNMRVSPEQVSAARLLLGWTQDALAAEVGISKWTLCRFETSNQRPSEWIVLAIRLALEDAGVEFTLSGVKLHDSKATSGIIRAKWDRSRDR
jgi:DNA-binding XRE family transcriptional regulator